MTNYKFHTTKKHPLIRKSFSAIKIMTKGRIICYAYEIKLATKTLHSDNRNINPKAKMQPTIATKHNKREAITFYF
jgi:hypothetical protein